MQSTSAKRKRIKQVYKGNSHFTFKGVRLGGCLFLLCLLYSCNNKNQQNVVKKINSIKKLLSNGDVIFRNGTDDISRAARSFNRQDKTYSHCGIIAIENDSVFVYHEIGGVYNPSNQLIRQPIDSFCNPSEADKFAVYRYPLSDTQKDALSKLLQAYYHAKLSFDFFFNFYTDDKMYCSEFVFKSINTATNGLIKGIIHTDQTPLYIALDDLYINEYAKLIINVRF